MWLLEFLFFAVILLIGWTLFGYFIFIWFVGLFRKQETPSPPNNWPKISVVIPCYNEEQDIIEKVNNTKKLDYSRECLEIIFVDGGSTDKTLDLLNAAVKDDRSCNVVHCPNSGKINQLNYVLPRLKGDIIVNTDVDAILSLDTLKLIAEEFSLSEDIWVVGAYCYPEKTLEVEKYYWSTQNKGRFLENSAGRSSIVVAPCYAFRKGLLKIFPEDVVADDVYIGFLANSLGYRTIYSFRATAVETRNPQRYSDFLPHKFRKSNAFLKESLRFLYKLPEMKPLFKVMFLTRIVQQLYLPWAMFFWILIAGILITLFRYDIVIFGSIFLIIMLVLTSRIFASVRLPNGSHRYSIRTVIQGYILTVVIMLTTGFSYPFFKQGSSYRRIAK